jgi:hypothetical protein
MKLEKQVCTKGQSKKMRELGIVQKSVFYYHPNFKRPVIGTTMTRQGKHSSADVMVCNLKPFSISAFTDSEMGVMIKMIGLYSAVNSVLGGWAIHHINGYKEFEFPQPGNMNNYDTEAEARADIIISLLERGVIKVEEINRAFLND